MRLSKTDYKKIYGAKGLFNTALYIRKVISSCKTTTQLDVAFDWGIKVFEQEWKKISKGISDANLRHFFYVHDYFETARRDIYDERIKTLQQLLRV